MDYNDAVDAAKLLNVKKVIGVHYDTFGLIKINHNEAINAFSAENIELNLMKIGSTIKL
jgi:L-ascorbate metabolism protein UlaG (beta-lactamase superfamily)